MINFRFNPKICTKALHGKPGICRCARCRPDLHLPSSDATGPASAAAARHLPPPGGGNPLPSDGAYLAGAPLDPAADRSLPLSGNPVGGLCVQPSRSIDQ